VCFPITKSSKCWFLFSHSKLRPSNCDPRDQMQPGPFAPCDSRLNFPMTIATHAPFPSLHSTFCYTLRSTLLRRLRSQHGKNTQDHCCCKLPSGSWIRSGSFFPRPKDLEFRSFLFYVHKEFMLTGETRVENNGVVCVQIFGVAVIFRSKYE